MRMRELQVKYLPRSGISYDGRKCLRYPHESARLFHEIFANELVEVFGTLLLTTKHRVICYHEVARGTLDSLVVQPREIFRAAFLANAAAIIIGHNHPSGDPTASDPDKRLTARLVRAGDLLGIPVIDHIITGEQETGRFYSFSEERLL